MLERNKGKAVKITNPVLSHVTDACYSHRRLYAVLCEKGNKISLSGGVNLMRTKCRPKRRAAFAVLTLSENRDY